jgi:hypothetical protein
MQSHKTQYWDITWIIVWFLKNQLTFDYCTKKWIIEKWHFMYRFYTSYWVTEWLHYSVSKFNKTISLCSKYAEWQQNSKVSLNIVRNGLHVETAGNDATLDWMSSFNSHYFAWCIRIISSGIQWKWNAEFISPKVKSTSNYSTLHSPSYYSI